MELVAFLGNDKENWGQVKGLVNRGEWDKVILIAEKGVEGFPVSEGVEIVKVDSGKSLLDLKKDIMDKMKSRLRGDLEVAISIASGNGKDHMALISALLSLPVGIRIVVFTKDGIEYIN